MPRIDAPTVALHHAQQRRALIDSARVLIAETGESPNIRQVGQRAGLARSSVYHYFASAEELLTAVAAEVFPEWIAGVQNRVNDASTPGTRVWAYIEANFALFASPEHSVAQVLSRVVTPPVLDSPMKDFHHRLQFPLLQALNDLGEPEPNAMAALIDSLILEATHKLGRADHLQTNDRQAASLARIGRLLSGYLQLSPVIQEL